MFIETFPNYYSSPALNFENMCKIEIDKSILLIGIKNVNYERFRTFVHHQV